MDDEDEVEYETCSYPWSWRSTAVIAGDFVSDILHSAARLTDLLVQQVAADHNYRIHRKQFAESAALEIESLIGNPPVAGRIDEMEDDQ